MRSTALERRLATLVLALFALPTLLVGLGLVALAQGDFPRQRPDLFTAVAAGGLLLLVAYLTATAIGLTRPFARRLEEVRLGAELIATVNPDHRLEARRDESLADLALEVNRLADRLAEARQDRAEAVAAATHDLALERAKLAAVLDVAPEGVLLLRTDGRVTLANRAARGLLAAAAGGASLLGRDLHDVVDAERLGHALADAAREPETAPRRFLLRPRPIPGHPDVPPLLQAVLAPFAPEPTAPPEGFVLLLRDISRAAEVEEQRRASLATALHDLRNPLASIRSLSESLLAEPGQAAAETARRLLDAIHSEAVRMSGVLRDLAEPMRLGLAAPPTHYDEVAVADLLRLVRRRLRQPTSAETAALEVEVEGAFWGLPPLRAEAGALSASLERLARRAAQEAATGASGAPVGPVRLRVQTRGERLLHLEVSVAARAELADLEAALDRPAERDGGGTVRDIVRRHAGEAWAFADRGEAGFRVTLPLGSPAADGAAPAHPSPLGGAGLRSGWDPAAGPSPERPLAYDFSLLRPTASLASPAERDQPLRALACVVFDTETTGLDPRVDRVVSVAAVRVRDGQVRQGETFDCLVQPGRRIPPASIAFHGITDDMVAEAPPLPVVLDAFRAFVGDAALVGHQVAFDLAFLRQAVERLGLPPFPGPRPVLDTLLLSTLVHGPLEGHGLEHVAERLGVTVRGRHSALGDALATAEVYVRLLSLLERRGIHSLGQALDALDRASAEPPGLAFVRRLAE